MANVFNFTVLKTSQKGNLLITNGKQIAWVKKRAMRKDGTFGTGAVRALDESSIAGSTLDDYEKYNSEVLSVHYNWGPEFKTEKAYLLNGTWLPKSLTSFEKDKENDGFIYTAPRWILKKAYLI